MLRVMDFHENLKLPADAIALGVDCGVVHRVDGIT